MLKVHPVDHNMANSISNTSTVEPLERSAFMACRYCKKIYKQTGSSNQLFPCHCFQPIHTQCLMAEMDQVCKGEITERGRFKKFMCPKCKEKIRFTVDENLRCRPFCEMISFGRSQRCFCVWLTIGSLLLVSLIVVLIVFLSSSQKLNNQYNFQALGIGLGIAIGVIFLLVAYFCISELMIQRDYEIHLMANSRQRHRRNNSSSLVQITNCDQ